MTPEQIVRLASVLLCEWKEAKSHGGPRTVDRNAELLWLAAQVGVEITTRDDQWGQPWAAPYGPPTAPKPLPQSHPVAASSAPQLRT